ncbi:ABC transporter ATP-binding protein [Leptospira meyeri]|uniref:ABC transporter ATP-binding protein n=1 Tax=Leptospira meyeri TaxID=29508 RepID=UPI000C2B0928|nr:ABC transporter ATP-binding protein [Leptospira meyeri]PKA26268.1 lipoprotein-releasing system ATP-binding protein LolD [Leptospira sp. mixed culture ATI2-C-A1]MCW7487352.1 ABC transporter ATP-binding protein [Leptospira meyeri]PJZ80832.1 lipoprotein-releasing system ATP-binding protein LolD [Leptospira meyeri]PJZ96336.1 lipoprotein-releasing system ATP-binding protein LolD [Leptospira meyeri]PKA12713.1 lipoprotein-releasing system ATP-binding protein LolD [Leptospira meyeri]
MNKEKKESVIKTAIQIKNVNKSFQQGEATFPVLNDISFEIAEKKLVTLMGPSGSGKSTLLNLLSAIESADSGQINVFGNQLIGATEKDLTIYRRKTIGIVFQFFHLFPYLSAVENVSLPLYLSGTPKKIAESKAKEVLSLVGLDHRKEFTPKEMSGGEKQRVSIARAIVHQPKLILADEPTGNLDSHSSEMIMELFTRCVKDLGITVFLVTHNEQIGQSGDINLRMLDGKIKSK